jgi:excisionase family DNA binding protein
LPQREHGGTTGEATGRLEDNGGHRSIAGGHAQSTHRETLRIAEAADLLGVSVRTLEDRRWRVKHRIPVIRVGRCVVFRRLDLERYLDRHRERIGRMSLASALP